MNKEEEKVESVNDLLKEIGTLITNLMAESLPEDYRFTLFLHNIKAKAGSNDWLYVSSAQKAEVLKVAQEFIDKNKPKLVVLKDGIRK